MNIVNLDILLCSHTVFWKYVISDAPLDSRFFSDFTECMTHEKAKQVVNWKYSVGSYADVSYTPL